MSISAVQKGISNISSTSVAKVAKEAISPAKLYETTTDVFERKQVVKDTAKGFWGGIIKNFSDFKSTGKLPADGEAGNEILKKIIRPYNEFVQKLIPSDAEKFTQLTMGSEAVGVLKNASKTNSTVDAFVHNLETAAKDNLENIVKKPY